ncbi:hypothetical protein SAMN05428946_0236 [Edaphobacillus lindanitolerans]|uniref:Uncharacterized protein n=1 Tax=Edaphobacillus lindanitolerans TaxID=550447 RepID=A0A1U7PLH8_9BACI|nr:hypothetical protein SAMN05428946_0236 [Edaphobacillus lindanitolerans]
MQHETAPYQEKSLYSTCATLRCIFSNYARYSTMAIVKKDFRRRYHVDRIEK